MPTTEGTLERTHPDLIPIKPGKPYLIAIRLDDARVRPGHMSLLKSLERVSCVPPIPLFDGSESVFGFRSTLSMGEISAILGDGKNFLDDDSYIVVEIASDYLVLHSEVAKAWLRTNIY